MVLATFAWLFIAGIVYYHYLQGFFSATLSALMAVLAAMIAIGWHENLTSLVNRGALSDVAFAICMVGIFVLTYSAMRFAFDKLVPGNVRFPVMLDKIGAAAMGLVAGVAVAGIAVVAAQTLPLRPSVGGYSRYAMVEASALMAPGPGQKYSDVVKFEVVNVDKFKKNDTSSDGATPLVDDVLMKAVYYLSDENGSLAGNPIQQAHPDYLQEMFAQRIGIQTAAKHTALPDWAKLEQGGGVYSAKPEWQIDVEGTNARPAEMSSGFLAGQARGYKPEPFDKTLLVVRVFFDLRAADTDGFTRMSPASARLLVKKGEQYTNYFCAGVLDRTGHIFYSMHLDDPIVIEKDAKFIDLAFEQPPETYAQDKDGVRKMLPTALLEVKRLARIDLSNKEIAPFKADPEKYGFIVKKDMPGPEQAPAAQKPEKLLGTWETDYGNSRVKMVITADKLTRTSGGVSGQGTSTSAAGEFRVLSTKGMVHTVEWSKEGKPEQVEIEWGWYGKITLRPKDPSSKDELEKLTFIRTAAPTVVLSADSLNGVWEADVQGAHVKVNFSGTSLTKTTRTADGKTEEQTGTWKVLSIQGSAIRGEWTVQGANGTAVIPTDVNFDTDTTITVRESGKSVTVKRS